MSQKEFDGYGPCLKVEKSSKFTEGKPAAPEFLDNERLQYLLG